MKPEEKHDETADESVAETDETQPAADEPKPTSQPPELLIELARGLEQIDKKGELDNAAAIVREIRKNYPYEFRTERTAVGIDGGAGATAANPLTRDMLAKMRPSDIAKLDWQAVRHVLENTK
jgi:hypothetical protein